MTSVGELFAAIEFNGDFSYSRQVFGSGRENNVVNRDYTAGMAFYFLSLTAIEFNYSLGREIITQDEDREISDLGLTIQSSQSRINKEVYGVGLRQALAPRGSFIFPTVSLGYAKQFSRSQRDFVFIDNTTNVVTNAQGTVDKQRQDSFFGTFALSLKLTKSLSFRGSVRTVFPFFKSDQARDNIRYGLGLSWLFQ